MPFELTREIIDQIIFAMENQETGFIFDSESHTVVQNTELAEEDPERYLPIPEWNSADGFHLMEKFVSSLRNPLASEKLRAALASGKGVFRNFKNTLKEQEGVERLWFGFKDKEMKLKVAEWYNELCDAWGTAHVKPDPDENETEALVLSDFEIHVEQGANIDLIRYFDREAYFEANLGIPAPLVEESFRRSRAGRDPGDKNALVLSTITPGGDLAGFIWGAEEELMPRDIDGTGSGESLSALQVLQLFVLPDYRGLGIAKTLVERLCRIAYERGAQRLVIELPGSSEILQRHLSELGFAVFSRSMLLDVERWGQEIAET